MLCESDVGSLRCSTSLPFLDVVSCLFNQLVQVSRKPPEHSASSVHDNALPRMFASALYSLTCASAALVEVELFLDILPGTEAPWEQSLLSFLRQPALSPSINSRASLPAPVHNYIHPIVTPNRTLVALNFAQASSISLHHAGGHLRRKTRGMSPGTISESFPTPANILTFTESLNHYSNTRR